MSGTSCNLHETEIATTEDQSVAMTAQEMSQFLCNLPESGINRIVR